MEFSTERYARKKSKTKKQEERTKRLTSEKAAERKRKQNKFDRLNVMK